MNSKVVSIDLWQKKEELKSDWNFENEWRYKFLNGISCDMMMIERRLDRKELTEVGKMFKYLEHRLEELDGRNWEETAAIQTRLNSLKKRYRKLSK